MTGQAAGPLSGIRVLEVQAIGSGPFCAMVLCDFGADVVGVGRADAAGGGDGARAYIDVLSRGRRSVAGDVA
jgi:alpha-methylacyl-CoA racemase